MKATLLLIACLLGLPVNHLLSPAEVLQVDVSSLLNARPVTTLTNGKLITWNKGIDGGGTADGYLTQAAALFNGDKDPQALPNDPAFAASTSHPEIILHYNNADSVNNQARSVAGAGEFSFKVPEKKYSDMYLALTSSEGASPLKIQLIYADGLISYRNFLMPDYYQDLPPTDPNICYLAHNLAKWGTKNNMREKDHHNIDLLNLHPDPARVLTGIKIKKGQTGYLVFWAATGVTAE